MSELNNFQTPMMRQYAAIKSKHTDAILFFRLGDFYEMFLDDAKVGAEILDITLTARNKGKDGKIPMAGVPYHSADSYIAKLVKNGYKVAICEQVSDPSESGLVEREVVRVVTPGTLLDEKHLKQDSNNFVMGLELGSEKIGVAVADLGTGEYKATQANPEALADELERFRPREVLLSKEAYQDPKTLKRLKNLNVQAVFAFEDWPNSHNGAALHLRGFYDVETLEGFGLKGKAEATVAAAALLKYLQETQKGRVQHLQSFSYYHAREFLALDATTIRNLELFSTLREGERSGSLWGVLNDTQTAMGGRMLRSWMLQPLVEADLINRRLEVVDFLVQNRDLRDKLRDNLQNVKDIERILSRLSVGTANGRDLVGLKESLEAVQEITEILPDVETQLIASLQKTLGLSATAEMADLIDTAIQDDPAATLREGGMIADGFNEDLDRLRQVTRGGKDWLARLEKKEKKRSGIESLKVGFNKVYGYYIEVSKAKAKNVPENYVRKQTLTNSERYITQELKEHEEKVLTAEEEVKELEYQLFGEVVDEVLQSLKPLQQIARAVATIDALANFAHLAESHRYTRPKIKPLCDAKTHPTGAISGDVRIKGGRHPVIEKLQKEQQFVPNDTRLDSGENQIQIITGANMAGKSTYIRQVALIVLMAQMGSFVPAESAEISIVDRIFTRLGASDQLASGLSTFMVEMVETANILNNLTDDSLVILDEVGRGTSTYDGISIAWSIAEHLALNTNAKTLFATHYHELTELGEQLENVQNFSMAVADEPESEEIVFLYQVTPGGADRSYGIHVAQKAGLPRNVIRRAREILETLEEIRSHHHERKKLKELPLFASDNNK